MLVFLSVEYAKKLHEMTQLSYHHYGHIYLGQWNSSVRLFLVYAINKVCH